jgi:hypothetical protein
LCAGIASQFPYRAQKNVANLFTLSEKNRIFWRIILPELVVAARHPWRASFIVFGS